MNTERDEDLAMQKIALSETAKALGFNKKKKKKTKVEYDSFYNSNKDYTDKEFDLYF